MFLKIVCLFVILFLNPNLYALEENNSIRFEHISVEQGLSQSGVHCILQDNKGFLWFGTWDGLNRYDGYTFTIFKNDPDNPETLSHNSIRAICEDKLGRLWIGTEGGGLNQFDPQKERFILYQNDPKNPYSLSHNVVLSIYEDHNGRLWIGTEGGGLNRFNPENKKFIRYQNQPDDPQSLSSDIVHSICEDSEGILWIGTENGLNRFNPERKQFIRYRNDPDDPGSLSHNNIRSICEERDGLLWIGTENGLNVFDREKESFIRYQNDPNDPNSLSHNEIRVIYKDRKEMLWIGTEGGGLNKFDSKEKKFIRYQSDPANLHSLSHNVVWSLYEDRSGVLWIGTYTGGLNKSDRGKEQFLHYISDSQNSLSNNVVWSLFEDHNQMLWIGTDNGLNKFDREKKEFTHYKNEPDNPGSLSNNEVWSVYEDRNKTLWVGTFCGLNRFDQNNKRFTRYIISQNNQQTNKIRVMCEDYRGLFWIGTGDGLYQFDRKNEEFLRYQNQPDNPHSLSHNNVWSLYEDSSERLWIGTEDGLNLFDRKNNQFVQYKNIPDNTSSLSNNWVLSIYEDSRKILWIGTVSGLNQFDTKEERFNRYREKDGLPNEVIYGILEDNQERLWLSTNKGLSRFSPSINTFKNYDARDGLQGNEFNVGAYHRNRKGELFFGGLNGFNLFYPSQKDNPYPPSIVITDFRIFNESVPVSKDSILKKSIAYTDEIRLSYKERVFSFEFVALHFASPEKNQYAYKMEGFDKDWIWSGTRRFVTYTNLPAGRYSFRVKGSNNDGLWNEEGTSIRMITITPPPWKTCWAYALYVSIVVSLLLGYVRYKTKAQADEIELHRKELEQKRQLAEVLECKVKERTCKLKGALEEVKEANKHITDSLNYARLIQRTLLPSSEVLKTAMPDSFVLWMPRDIVGGDIFFFDLFDNGFVIAVIDCTGHGVPGAFMTMIAFSGLKRIISDEGCHDPGEILKRLNLIVKTSLQQDTEHALTDDGLDAAICVIKMNSGYFTSCELTFSGAKLSLFYTQDDEIKEIKGEKQSIGYKRSNLDFEYPNHVISIINKINFYMATDGFTDQLGSNTADRDELKRFGKRRLTELLRKNSHLPFEEQKKKLLSALNEYQGDADRQDDITVVGFGFK